MIGSSSPTLVVDASALLDVLATDGEAGDDAYEALLGHRWAAPEHLFVETFNAIRGRVLGGKMTTTSAATAIQDLAAVSIELVPTALLLGRMWELRDNLSGYDAACVAAAEHLGVPLVTADKRLAAAPGLQCEVRTP